MLRNLSLLGLLVGASVLLPYFYERNPEAVHRWVDAVRGTEQQAAETAPAPEKPIRLAAVEQPSPEPEIQSLPGRKVLVKGDDRGHFVTEFRLNGRRIDALVDTGATMVAINRTTARQIGIALASGDFKYTVSTANGQVKAAAAVIGRIQVGRIALDNVEAMVLEDSALDGVLVGMTFLKRLSRFEMRDGTLTLQQ